MWAATWQNQENDLRTQWRLRSAWASAQSDQIRVLAVRFMGIVWPNSSSCWQRRLIRLGGCPGWSEFLLGARSFCWFCHAVAHVLMLESPRHGNERDFLSWDGNCFIPTSNILNKTLYSVSCKYEKNLKQDSGLLSQRRGWPVQSDVPPPGMQSVVGSILRSGNTLSWRFDHEIISVAIISPYHWFK